MSGLKTRMSGIYQCMYAGMYVCMYVCMSVCMFRSCVGVHVIMFVCA